MPTYRLNPLKEAKEPKEPQHWSTPVTMHRAEYIDSFGRKMSAGYHDTPEKALKAAKRDHRNSRKNYGNEDMSVMDPGRILMANNN